MEKPDRSKYGNNRAGQIRFDIDLELYNSWLEFLKFRVNRTYYFEKKDYNFDSPISTNFWIKIISVNIVEYKLFDILVVMKLGEDTIGTALTTEALIEGIDLSLNPIHIHNYCWLAKTEAILSYSDAKKKIQEFDSIKAEEFVRNEIKIEELKFGN